MKNLMNLGKSLNKNEQKEIFGGAPIYDGGVFCDGPIVYECQGADDCGWITDPLTGNMANGSCQVYACGTYCRYSLH